MNEGKIFLFVWFISGILGYLIYIYIYCFYQKKNLTLNELLKTCWFIFFGVMTFCISLFALIVEYKIFDNIIIIKKNDENKK